MSVLRRRTSLHSVCLSVWFQFSGLFFALDEDIWLKFSFVVFLWIITDQYSCLLSLDLPLTELCPLKNGKSDPASRELCVPCRFTQNTGLNLDGNCYSQSCQCGATCWDLLMCERFASLFAESWWSLLVALYLGPPIHQYISLTVKWWTVVEYNHSIKLLSSSWESFTHIGMLLLLMKGCRFWPILSTNAFY
jgi:hypothetical protein